MPNITRGHDMKLNKNVMKMNEKLQCIQAKLKLTMVFG